MLSLYYLQGLQHNNYLSSNQGNQKRTFQKVQSACLPGDIQQAQDFLLFQLLPWF